MDYFKNSMDEYEYMHILKPELKNSWLKAPLTPTKEISDDKFAPIGEMSLDGEWDMMPEAGHNDFSAAYKAVIPGSVHSALFKHSDGTFCEGYRRQRGYGEIFFDKS